MIIDITCPATKKAICEYEFGMDIRKIVKSHMRTCHPDWYWVRGLDYLPKTSPPCPICHKPIAKARYIDNHVAHMHRSYVKVDILEYRLRSEVSHGAV